MSDDKFEMGGIRFSDREIGGVCRGYIENGRSVEDIAKMIGARVEDVKRFTIAAGGCQCGSGQEPRWFKDARDIELFKGCDACAPEKLAGYRPEVLTDPNLRCIGSA
jgi:hypothetical protein